MQDGQVRLLTMNACAVHASGPVAEAPAGAEPGPHPEMKRRTKKDKPKKKEKEKEKDMHINIAGEADLAHRGEVTIIDLLVSYCSAKMGAYS